MRPKWYILLALAAVLIASTIAISLATKDTDEDTDQGILVSRWYHPGEKDWVSIAETEASDSQIRSWGYKDKNPQFYAQMNKGPNMVAVNRWYHPGEKDWVSIAETEASDSQIRSWGYEDKNFQFYALKLQN